MDPLLNQISSTLWSQESVDVGHMKGASPLGVNPKSLYHPYKRQYPLKAEAIEGISPIIQDLLKRGVTVPCPDSSCNMPLFPFKKEALSTR